MPHAIAADGTKLYYEETGTGIPIVFVHELAGDSRVWEPQIRWFCRRYRCIAFNARGYPPSDVPSSIDDYSYVHAANDIQAVMEHVGIEKAHVVGFSMGANAVLHFGFRHPQMATSLTVIGIGYGADADKREQFLQDTENFARRLETLPMPEAVRPYAVNPTRVQFQSKDPRGWKEFADQFAGHSAVGKALTLRGVLARRPPIPDLERELRSLQLPTLVITGDEDDACLAPGIFLKRTIPNASLWVVPGAGHTVTLEEPDVFNRQLFDFLSTIDLGRWRPRDPRSRGKSTLGNDA